MVVVQIARDLPTLQNFYQMTTKDKRLAELIELAAERLSLYISEDSPEYKLFEKVIEGEEADYSLNLSEDSVELNQY